MSIRAAPFVPETKIERFEEGFNDYIGNIPGFSTTDEIFKFVNSKFPRNILAEDDDEGEGFEERSAGKRIFHSFCRTTVHLTLGILAAPISLVVNLALFISKLVMAFVFRWRAPSEDRYLHAQKLAEDAFFHLFTAVYDFALNFFVLIRLPISLLSGFMPEMIYDIHDWMYRYDEGEITHMKGASETERQENRNEYCFLRGLADAVQCCLFPDADVDSTSTYFGRVSNAFKSMSTAAQNRRWSLPWSTGNRG